tara:strand:+ start:232 stop:588 length:357 start_codon:yes stop_codon:yes gene_type:complete
MAYFAKLGVGDTVEEVVAVNDDIAVSEQAGEDFLNATFKTNNVWRQTYLVESSEIDGSKSVDYAGVGWTYDRDTGLFSCPPAIPTDPIIASTEPETRNPAYGPTFSGGISHPDNSGVS